MELKYPYIYIYGVYEHSDIRHVFQHVIISCNQYTAKMRENLIQDGNGSIIRYVHPVSNLNLAVLDLD